MADDAQPVLEVIKVRCCIVGGGPAGMMLGYLLARAGISVVVLEKHADFLRDFRGDTIHPSTLELLHELGNLPQFLELPHQEVTQFKASIGDRTITFGDFGHLPTHCRFIAFMPQWEFLNFVASQAQSYPTFQLRMNTEGIALIEADGRIAGVQATGPGGRLEIHADLTVAADGRHSTLRQQAGLELIDVGAPIDVLWMRISRRQSDPGQLSGRFQSGRVLIMIDRGEYWQCAFVIRKGGYDEIRQRGLPAFQRDIAQIAPFVRDRVDELDNWDIIRLLTVAVNRLKEWQRPGLLCIGDAAHAMSPVGGVGINLAIQDAVAAANLLCKSLSQGPPTIEQLKHVQARREQPARVIQRLQVFVHRNLLYRALSGRKQSPLPWFVPWLFRIPRLRRLPGRIIGLGVRPEHIETPDAFAGQTQPNNSAMKNRGPGKAAVEVHR